MSTGRDGITNARSHNGSSSAAVFATIDDGYWEALLEEGEVSSLEAPPPWVQETQNKRFGSSHYGDGDWDEEQDWQRAQQLLHTEECCHLTVTGYNRGGLLVEFGKVSGFVPSSHLIDFPTFADPNERESALIARVGQTLKLQVIEIDRLRGRLILSQRIACEDERGVDLFARLKVGDVVTGRVSNLRRFGAFVDLGGFEGLIHISELSWGRVNYPGDVVEPGDEVRVYVLDVNPAERKIQLSLKQLLSDPWQGVAQRYRIGQVVEGEITSVVSFGAFTRLEDGVEGLIHISELAEGTFLHPRNVVREGQRVEVKVLNIDTVNRRIGLSLRQTRAPKHPAHSFAVLAEQGSLAS